MKKTIILVEDDLSQVQDILLSIQSIIFVSSKMGLTNSPQDSDTKICVLHTLWDNQKRDTDSFDRIKRLLETRQQDLATQGQGFIPKLKYEYEFVSLEKNKYPDEIDVCSDKICAKIDTIRKDSSFVIMLDLVLLKEVDQNRITENGDKILSQVLYQKYVGNCIPYTNYDEGDFSFPNKWSHGVVPPKTPYERFVIDGNVIYKPFKDEIYKCLKIGE
ncbi:MAG: hypothetical protein IJZ35_01220 [Clostridia bacterium]|nr:hypothetical protein [Clostridia bacterium]